MDRGASMPEVMGVFGTDPPSLEKTGRPMFDIELSIDRST